MVNHLCLIPLIYNENMEGHTMKKTKIYLNEAEWRFVIHSLNELKTKLHSEG